MKPIKNQRTQENKPHPRLRQKNTEAVATRPELSTNRGKKNYRAGVRGAGVAETEGHHLLFDWIEREIKVVAGTGRRMKRAYEGKGRGTGNPRDQVR